MCPTRQSPAVAGRAARAAALAAGAWSLAACSLLGGAGHEPVEGPGQQAATDVVVATHDSWAVPPALLDRFEARSGYRVVVHPSGDAGALTNRLVLTRSSPIADAVFGIDSTFATRAVEEGILDEHIPAELPASAQRFALPDESSASALTPVDFGDVCVNVDDAWFAEHGIEPPTSLEDLTSPTYRDLLVVPGATTSSPGLAFLLATIAVFGEGGWQDYWSDLLANGAKLTSGWSEAYEVDFTAGGQGGDRPIVVSYASSPPVTVPSGGSRPTTSALLDTCFRQVEYAGVLAGAANPEGAEAFVDFLVSRPFQQALPESMYVFPVDLEAPLPSDWERWARTPQDPLELDPARITANRDRWLREWGDLASR